MKRNYAFMLFAAAACGQTLSTYDGGTDAPDVLGVDVATEPIDDAPAVVEDGSADADALVEAEGGCPPVVHTNSVATTFQIDALHSGAQLGDALTLPLCLRWKHTFIGRVSYPVVGSGNVFVTIADQTNSDLYALRTSSGAYAWGPVQVASNTSVSVPAYDQGLIFVSTGQGAIKAFDAVNGNPKWTTSVSNQLSGAPTPWNGLLFVNTSSTFYALSEVDGSVVWSRPVTGNGGSAPSVDDSGVYAGYACNTASAFEPLDGSLHWQHTGYCTSYSSATPRVANGRVYTRAEQMLMLSAIDGSVIGTYPTSGAIPVYGGPNVAITEYGIGIAAFTMPEMSPTLWTFAPTNDAVADPPLVVGSNVVVAGANGTIDVVDLATGVQIATTAVGSSIDFSNDWSTQSNFSGLAAADGMLFVPAHDTLVAY